MRTCFFPVYVGSLGDSDVGHEFVPFLPFRDIQKGVVDDLRWCVDFGAGIGGEEAAAGYFGACSWASESWVVEVPASEWCHCGRAMGSCNEEDRQGRKEKRYLKCYLMTGGIV